MSDIWLVVIAFVIGAVIIVGRLAWVHKLPRLPRRLRKLGPLPSDPGMPKRAEIDGDPFRGKQS